MNDINGNENGNKVVSKSFKYRPDERPKVHEWMLSLKESGKDFSESVRRLIENDHREREQLRKDIDDLRQAIASIWMTAANQVAAGGQAGQGGKIGISPKEEAELIEIGEVVEAIAEQPEIKKVNINAMKNRYQL